MNPAAINAESLDQPKYTMSQLATLSQCSPATIQNRISRGLLPVLCTNPGTGNVRLFTVREAAKLVLMVRLGKIGIAAFPAYLISEMCLGANYDGPAVHAVESISKRNVAAIKARTQDEALACAKPGVWFMIDTGEILNFVTSSLCYLPPIPRRGRPRRST